MTVLSCQNLELRIGYKPLLQNVQFEIARSSSVALTGPNGCGKTTLLRTLAGIARPYKGTVVMCDDEIWPNRNVTKENLICFHASAPALLLDHSVQSNIEFQCESFGAKVGAIEIKNALERVGLEGRNLQIARTLSTGQKRRLCLASLLLIKPQIVLADEPTNGLDTSGKKLCLELFEELKQQCGTTFLVATHDEPIVAACDGQIDLERFAYRRRAQ